MQRIHTKTHMLLWTHLTLIETRGWQFLPLTGSIRGQSAAEPHAAQQQRATLDYTETAARHTIEEDWGDGGGGLGLVGLSEREERDDGSSRRQRGTGDGERRVEGLIYFLFPKYQHAGYSAKCFLIAHRCCKNITSLQFRSSKEGSMFWFMEMKTFFWRWQVWAGVGPV